MPDVSTPDNSINPYSANPAISGPGSKSVDIDAEVSDSELLSKVVRAIRTDVAGTMKFHVQGDAADVFRTVTLAAGEKLDLWYIDQVWNTGTTATGLLGTI